jgi:hypothetical protein
MGKSSYIYEITTEGLMTPWTCKFESFEKFQEFLRFHRIEDGWDKEWRTRVVEGKLRQTMRKIKI